MAYVKLYSLVLLVGLCHLSLAQTDWCDPALCYGTATHVACNYDGVFKSECPSNVARFEYNDVWRSLILDTHNELRNKAAKGVGGLPSAKRMPVLRWNNELADLAAMNSVNCAAYHDECRNTPTFKYVGQNMDYRGSAQMASKPLLERQIRIWFQEYEKANSGDITSYPANNKEIGAFAAMVQDKATDIGCAMNRFTKPDGKAFNGFTCNYSYVNVVGRPVYETGATASGCTTGTDGTYTSLCSSSEVYDHNTLPGITGRSIITQKWLYGNTAVSPSMAL